MWMCQHCNTLSSLLDSHAPLKQRSVSVPSLSPWFTPDILQAKRKRRRFERKWRCTKSDLAHLRNTEQCRMVKDLVRNAKEIYFSSLIDHKPGDQRTLFRSIDQLPNRKPEARFPTCSTDKQLAQNFSEFFVEKIDTIRARLVATTDIDLVFPVALLLMLLHVNLLLFSHCSLDNYLNSYHLNEMLRS